MKETYSNVENVDSSSQFPEVSEQHEDPPSKPNAPVYPPLEENETPPEVPAQWETLSNNLQSDPLRDLPQESPSEQQLRAWKASVQHVQATLQEGAHPLQSPDQQENFILRLFRRRKKERQARPTHSDSGSSTENDYRQESEDSTQEST